MTMHQDLLLNKITEIVSSTDESNDARLVSMCDDANRIFITGQVAQN